MGGHETQRVAVCAQEAGELAALVEVIRGAGAWSILPVQWPNERALAAATDAAHVVVLSSRPPLDEALVLELGARREGLPLIVVGPRSEERRVGKECRARWSPDQVKKKYEYETHE